MIKVKGKGGIEAVIVADSKSSVDGQRITTFLLTYHRFVHAELMTHRMFSRNAMSSRAVPVKTMLDLVKNNPATPIHWGKNQAGMQAKEEHDQFVVWDDAELTKEVMWKACAEDAAYSAECFSKAGYHKQLVNRILEPFQMIRVLVTATSFDNFFNLRFHEDSQPEICELARCMLVAFKHSTPEVLHPGEWHTPFVEHERDGGMLHYSAGGRPLLPEDAIKVSCSCAAQTSYRKADTSIEKALSIYEKLVGSDPAHSSAFEHCATPIDYGRFYDTTEMDSFDGLTHIDKNSNAWSNNFKGWIQYRALIPNNVCVSFDYSKEVDETGLEITDVSGEEI